jgi:predicted nucleic acid-binding protein
MVLVDTSVWIETFKARRPLDLSQYVDIDEVVTCLPVVQEVLQGFREERTYRMAHDAMLAFPIVESPLPQNVFIDAVTLFRAGRRAGVTIRSSVDCLIAACALRNDLEVLHRDRDYAELARVSGLRQRGI